MRVAAINLQVGQTLYQRGRIIGAKIHLRDSITNVPLAMRVVVKGKTVDYLYLDPQAEVVIV